MGNSMKAYVARQILGKRTNLIWNQRFFCR
jgi:hypothetical protein